VTRVKSPSIPTVANAPRDLAKLLALGPFVGKYLADELAELGLPLWSNDSERAAFIQLPHEARAQRLLKALTQFDQRSGSVAIDGALDDAGDDAPIAAVPVPPSTGVDAVAPTDSPCDKEPRAPQPPSQRAATVVELRSVATLVAHPANAVIYRDGADDALIADILEHGILQPLVVTEKGVIIAGHRRLDAARRLGMTEVPVIVVRSMEGDEAEAAVIAANTQRLKTAEMMAREYARRKELEQRKARQRQVAAGAFGLAGDPAYDGTTPLRQNSAQGGVGRSRDIAAAGIPMSHDSLEKAAVVVRHADALRAQGDAKAAAQLLNVLNEKSVAKAHKLATGTSSPPSNKPPRTAGPKGAKVEAWPPLRVAATSPEGALGAILESLVSVREAFDGSSGAAFRDEGMVAVIGAAIELLSRELGRRSTPPVPTPASPLPGSEMSGADDPPTPSSS